MLECSHIIERKILNHNFGPAFQQAAGSSLDPDSPIAKKIQKNTVSGPAKIRHLPFTHNIRPNVLDYLLSLRSPLA